MTPEQKYDRLERIARLMYEGALRSSRESRKQRVRLESYVAALREYDVAKQAVAAGPEDSEAIESLSRASQALNKAREELRR
jgi:hypothetical protein